MRLNPFCMCCAVNKQEQLLRKYQDPEKKTQYMKDVMKLLGNAGPEECAPSLSIKIKELFAKYWGVKEDFTREKREFNQRMQKLEAALEEKIRASKDPLETALLYARMGNYIDFATISDVTPAQMEKMMEEGIQEPLDSAEYEHFRADLEKASTLLYLTDNCGEIVLDKLVIKLLKELYPNLSITVMVRGFPVSNDATMEDAWETGLTDLVPVTDNGNDVGGTWLPGISREARKLLESADVIIAKGQGNFETLNECGLNIYYLFLCKCKYFEMMFQAKPLEGMFVNETRVLPLR